MSAARVAARDRGGGAGPSLRSPAVPSLLVTNDFPPKVGGIQSYLWELWRRLPADQVTVLTSRYPGDHEFDRRQGFRIERAREWWLLPTPDLARRIDALAAEVGADVILLDPVFPLAALGPRLRAAPVRGGGPRGRAVGAGPPAGRAAWCVRRALRHASGVVAAGGFPAAEAARAAGAALPTLVIPPGVDVERFHPPADRAGRSGGPALRARLGLGGDGPVVVGASRLVRRKGFDTLVDAVARLDEGVTLVLVGAGRDRARLERRAVARGVDHRVRFLGRVPDAELVDVLGAADVFAMLCRDRWGGLEYEGFGIVFVEAAACGVPSVAGRSGGSAEAVVDGETGLVVPGADVAAAVDALAVLLADPVRRAALGAAARARAEAELSYDRLAERLRPLASGELGALQGGGAAGESGTVRGAEGGGRSRDRRGRSVGCRVRTRAAGPAPPAGGAHAANGSDHRSLPGPGPADGRGARRARLVRLRGLAPGRRGAVRPGLPDSRSRSTCATRRRSTPPSPASPPSADGRLDAVVHQAGIAVGGAFEDVPDALGRDVFETNVFGLLAVTRAALPLLRANGRGRVVAVSSSAGAMGSPGISWYVASKWAVEGWAESAALELATVGVDLLVVEPGPYRTEIFRTSERVIPADSAYRDLARAVERHVDVEVARQARDPSEVAERIARLLDDPRPRFRTPVGPQARLAWGMRGIVPWSWRRRLVQRLLGPAARPSTPSTRPGTRPSLPAARSTHETLPVAAEPGPGS